MVDTNPENHLAYPKDPTKSTHPEVFQSWNQRLKLCISNHREYSKGM